MKQVVILMGAPGSGKGSQAKLFMGEKGFFHISTGDLLRAEVEKKTDFGQEIKSYIDNGALVPDSVILNIVESKIVANDKMLFDGFPRNIRQAEALEKIFEKNNIKDVFIVRLDVDDDIILERVVNRFQCAKCGAIYNSKSRPTKVKGVCDICGSEDFKFRQDDRLEVVKSRLDVYYKETAPVLDFYEKGGKHKVFGFDSTKDPSDLFVEIFEKLKI